MPLPSPLITSSPERLGGTPVFAGSRVPVQTLLDYLEAGDPLDAFLGGFRTSRASTPSRCSSWPSGALAA
jgi:uncharacterized protein (DUF433 family)